MVGAWRIIIARRVEVLGGERGDVCPCGWGSRPAATRLVARQRNARAEAGQRLVASAAVSASRGPTVCMYP